MGCHGGFAPAANRQAALMDPRMVTVTLEKQAFSQAVGCSRSQFFAGAFMSTAGGSAPYCLFSWEPLQPAACHAWIGFRPPCSPSSVSEVFSSEKRTGAVRRFHSSAALVTRGGRGVFCCGPLLPGSWQTEPPETRPSKSRGYSLMSWRLNAERLQDGQAACTSSRYTSEAAGVTENGLFSLSDEVLAARGLELSADYRELELEQLNMLFAKVGFPKREKGKLTIALEHTLALLWVREVRTGRLVAFARATGDAVFNAIIWDVVVDPSYQGSGLGKAVMERLMASLLAKGVCNIALYAEPNVVGFYKPLGFVSDPDGVRGMAYKRSKS